MSTSAENKPERIAKLLARRGVASRRGAERMIEAGRVRLNGKLLTTPAITVTEKDEIEIDGAPLAGKEPVRLWRYHKPPDLLTTHSDPGGRATVFENLPEDLGRVISVGRLDMTSEGLLLLTNDGELARALELPATAWARRYKARAYGKTNQNRLDRLLKGVMIDGVRTGPIEARLDKQQGTNAWMSITIREGKNREVRRALETLGLRVNRLIRLSYGPFQLGDLLREGIEEVPARILRDQVGHLIDLPKVRPEGTLTAKSKPKRARRSGVKTFVPASVGKKMIEKPAEKPKGKQAGKPQGKPSGKTPARKRASWAEGELSTRKPGGKKPAFKKSTLKKPINKNQGGRNAGRRR